MTRPTPFVIGVTGGIACGKSTVMSILAEHGVEIHDADRIYHSLIEPGEPLWAVLVDHYGESILDVEGKIDRAALGRIVFNDPAELTRLDALTHPAIVTETRRLISASQSRLFAVDAVKLIESGMADACDQVWLVACSPADQLARLMDRNGLSRENAETRIAAQASLDAARSRVDVIIDNSMDMPSTRIQVDAALSLIPILPI